MERKEEMMAEVLELVEARALVRLRNLLCEQNPADVAEIIGELKDKEIPLVFRILPKDLAGDAFSYMENDDRELLIRSFSDNELKEIVDELYVDDAADLVEEMPANVVQRILKNADPEMRSSINQILRYPEYSAGSIMTTEYVSLRPHMTVEEAILQMNLLGHQFFVFKDDQTNDTCVVYARKDGGYGLIVPEK